MLRARYEHTGLLCRCGPLRALSESCAAHRDVFLWAPSCLLAFVEVLCKSPSSWIIGSNGIDRGAIAIDIDELQVSRRRTLVINVSTKCI